jgi:hypothetical protein
VDWSPVGAMKMSPLLLFAPWVKIVMGGGDVGVVVAAAPVVVAIASAADSAPLSTAAVRASRRQGRAARRVTAGDDVLPVMVPTPIGRQVGTGRQQHCGHPGSIDYFLSFLLKQ